MSPEDFEYRCFQEAGHAIAAYIVGDSVEFIEMGFDGHASHTRVKRVNKNDLNAEQIIACGGFAVEYLLFKRKLITSPSGLLMTPQEFIASAMQNARIDKKIFGEAYNAEDGSRWAETLDNDFLEDEFKNFAKHQLVPRIESRWMEVEALAKELAAKNDLSRSEIEGLLTSVAKQSSLL